MTTSEIQAEVDRRFACQHVQAKARYRVASGGQRSFWRQCLRCGAAVGGTAMKRVDVPEGEGATAWDEGLRDEWYQAQQATWKTLSQRKRQEEKRAWLSEHDDYLHSTEWREKRMAALDRDGHQCHAALEGCAGAASQVHHTTYAHWRNEPLFDLVSVCGPCHTVITAMDRQRQGAA